MPGPLSGQKPGTKTTRGKREILSETQERTEEERELTLTTNKKSRTIAKAKQRDPETQRPRDPDIHREASSQAPAPKASPGPFTWGRSSQLINYLTKSLIQQISAEEYHCPGMC